MELDRDPGAQLEALLRALKRIEDAVDRVGMEVAEVRDEVRAQTLARDKAEA